LSHPLNDAANFYENWPAEMNATKAMAPDIGKAFSPFFQTLMKEGALDVKTKELIALGIAVAGRCQPCIYSHVEKCLKHGASGAQVMEAAGVAVMMGGGPSYTYTPVVAAAIEHLQAKAAATV
jgi:4-carboxymuconolactone decarboxylase